jgi:hypothetical protein
MLKVQAFLAAVVLLGCAAEAQAYINDGNSVEWLATFRPIIVEVKVTALDQRTEKAFNTVHFVTAKLTCEVTTVHKGKIKGPITFDFGAYKGDSPLGEVGATYLLYLDVDDETGKTIVTDYVNLDSPGTRFVPAVAYSKAGKILRTKAEILDALTGQLNLLKKSPVPDLSAFAPTAARTLMISAPGESEQSLWAGSMSFLRVPPDPANEAAMLEAAQKFVKAAAQGLKTTNSSAGGELFPLAFYSDEKANAVLRAALKDTNRYHVRLNPDEESHTPALELTVYPIRQCAYEILKAHGEKVDEPQGMTPYFRMQSNGGGVIVVFRAPGAKHNLYVTEEKSEPATQPAK